MLVEGDPTGNSSIQRLDKHKERETPQRRRFGGIGIVSEVVEVLFKGEERELFSNVTPVILRPGDHVVVEADKGEDMGRVILKGEWVSKKARQAPVRKIVRKATKEDLERRMANLEKEAEAFQVCRDRIAERELKMKLVDVECRFDGNRITFYFTAEKRVDFRELVKDLAAIYRTRIELRQIGVRDEAKRIGGFGSCGRKFCCSTFLREFEPVTLKMAKDQHLSLSPTKISGACGRLMCCLMYEVDTYRRCLENYPKVGAKIQLGGQEVQVNRVDIFREGVFVQDHEGGERYVSLAELGSRGRVARKDEPRDSETAADAEAKTAGPDGVIDGAEADERAWEQRETDEERGDELGTKDGGPDGQSADEGAEGSGDYTGGQTERGGQAAEEHGRGRGEAERHSGRPAGQDYSRRPVGGSSRGRPAEVNHTERRAGDSGQGQPGQERRQGTGTDEARRGPSGEGRRHGHPHGGGRHRMGGRRGRNRRNRDNRNDR
jgi:cell fate regulator YaaT (PSP1 superfamily)